MRINCLSCGHKLELDATYADFEGPVKCLCGAMLNIKIEDGQLKGIRLVPSRQDAETPCPEEIGGCRQ